MVLYEYYRDIMVMKYGLYWDIGYVFRWVLGVKVRLNKCDVTTLKNGTNSPTLSGLLLYVGVHCGQSCTSLLCWLLYVVVCPALGDSSFRASIWCLRCSSGMGVEIYML